MAIEVCELVQVLPTKIWAAKDIMGTVHVLMQHEGEKLPFDFVQIAYDHRYTCNSHQHDLTQKILALLGSEKNEAEPNA